MTVNMNNEELTNLDSQVLRALIREAVHHGVETRLYQYFNGKRDLFEVPEKLKKYLATYVKAQLSMDKDDIKWANEIISLLKKSKNGQKPEYEGHAPESYPKEKLKIVETTIFKRRSIRQWTDEKIPKSLLEKIVKAGIWAPTACNLQITRYLVLEDEKELQAISSREFSGEAAKIITLADKRPYEILSYIPRRNMLLDVGAAMQNMLIMAEALGLAAVWGTFNDKEIENIKSYFDLEPYYRLCAYISLGYPNEKVLAPGRISTHDAVLNW